MSGAGTTGRVRGLFFLGTRLRSSPSPFRLSSHTLSLPPPSLLPPLEAALASTPFLSGPGLSAADCAVVGTLAPALATPAGKEVAAAFPAVAGLVSAALAHPPIASALAAAALAPPPGAGDAAPLAVFPGVYPAWSGARTRATFVEFFETKAHTAVPSSPVVPVNDPTLLFANAGMNQFKPIFLGTVDPGSDLARLTRAADAQKCIRAGGKHNDLDDVGRDVYHHTFFEMMGNWSFGDYFKDDAIAWAWELLTGVFGLDPARLYATYFGGDASQGLPPDGEAQALWHRFLPPARVLPFGCADNFWEMGEVGPCGPCTEIHYDRVGGGRDAAALVNMDDPDVLEVWNLAFIQFNREDDASLRPLPARHVDTGLGLERLTSVLQGKMSNYATDLFAPLFDAIREVAGGDKSGPAPYGDRVGPADVGGLDMAYRVVADHARTLSFAIADGARPGPDGREYVLRRVLRRAVRYGRETLGAPEGFFARLVATVVTVLGGAYPELASSAAHIHAVISEEETSFSKTLLAGLDRFKKLAAKLPASGGTLSGPDAFLLWDTFGFPLDLTTLMAEEAGLAVDAPGFEAAMAAQRARSRADRKGPGGAPRLKFEAEATAHLADTGVPLTDDSPKYAPQPLKAKVLAILTATAGFVASTAAAPADGSSVGVILDRTPFYAEAGGQVADTGLLAPVEGGSASPLAVADVISAAGYVLHVIHPAGGTGASEGGGGDATPSTPFPPLAVGEEVSAQIDASRRDAIAPNHTFTHILNHALRSVLGEGVDQKGSVVDPDRLRFDFSHNGAVDPAALGAVEALCRASIAAAAPVFTEEVPLAVARGLPGVRAMFGEAYPDPVRVVSVGAPVGDLLSGSADPSAVGSIEFCGGTHLANTSDAGAFALVTEEGIAKGVRRVVGLTGPAAVEAIGAGEAAAAQARAAAGLGGAALAAAITSLRQSLDQATMPAAVKAAVRGDLAALIKKAGEEAKAAAGAAAEAAEAAAGAAAAAAAAAGEKVVTIRLAGVGSDPKAAGAAWAAAQRAAPGVACLIAAADAPGVPKAKAVLLAGVPADLSSSLPAGDWVGAALAVVGGKGGGKPTLAQGQGPDVEKVDEALATGKAWAVERLGGKC